MSQSGYYSQPTICKDRIVFVCDDNLWSVSAKGGAAHKLTNSIGECRFPRLSPDGKQVAFISVEEGHPEVFVVPYEGGAARRLTYLGGQSTMVFGWSPDGKKILFGSDARAPFYRHAEIFELTLNGHQSPLNLGHATAYAVDSKGRGVLSRNNSDPAYWKRYRGGRAGELWIDSDGKENYKPLIKLNGNMVSPMWVKGRVYFLSDHDGIGNIYSCRPDGRDLKQHTNEKEYYVRFPSTDGERIIYSVAAELYVLECSSGVVTHISTQASSQEQQASRKFANPEYYLEHFSLHPHGHKLGFISRGQAFSMPLFEGPCIKHGAGSEVRYRLLEWLADGEHFIVIDDNENYERIAKYSSTDIDKKPEYLSHEDIGRILEVVVSPNGKFAALSNHRYELLLLDIEKKKTYLMDTSPADRIHSMSWSSDNRWLVYNLSTHSNMSIIKVVDCKTYKSHEITRPVRMDIYPCFDPDGQYLYFLSNRDFKPVYDSQHFDLSFPPSVRPYLIPLQKTTPSPFAPDLKPFIKSSGSGTPPPPAAEATKPTKKTKAPPAPTVNSKDQINIDFDGIADRIIAFPFEEGNYSQLMAAKGRILFLSFAVKGLSRDFDWNSDDREYGSLITYDFNDQKTAALQTGITWMRLGPDNQTVIYKTKDRLRVIDGLQSTGKGPDGSSRSNGRSTGFIDLGRCNLLVEPRKEWGQMYREAWRLQKEHFWDEKMSAVDWDLVFDRYASLLPKVRTRNELSDLIWEMQGELGTSHAYEFGGDKPRPKAYYKGFLACDLDYDAKSDAYKIRNILRGDSWDREADSPLAEPGLGVEEGDLIVAVNGRRVSRDLSVDELLIKVGYAHVQLTLKRGTKQRAVTVRALHSDRFLRYRNWVEKNREIVKKATNDKVGYVHIPDMGPFGYAEFHRSYLSEFHHDGLIIDARYNRGGHVSSLLLEKLLRKRVGYDVPRWGQPVPYPSESPAGPMVALTNQFAGSDGDIFSHCFKLYELGPLVGKRTWGGVIGIHPRHRLVDYTITTQPEFSFWFKDVGWNVENYGTEPDYDVDFRPQDYKAGKDPQLEKGIQLILASLKKTPVKLPSFKSRPRLALPPVPRKRTKT